MEGPFSAPPSYLNHHLPICINHLGILFATLTRLARSLALAPSPPWHLAHYVRKREATTSYARLPLNFNDSHHHHHAHPVLGACTTCGPPIQAHTRPNLHGHAVGRRPARRPHMCKIVGGLKLLENVEVAVWALRAHVSPIAFWWTSGIFSTVGWALVRVI